MVSDIKLAQWRGQTIDQMQCPQPGCGQRLFITSSGMLLCETGHGKLISTDSRGVRLSLRRLMLAWPDRVIERYTPQAIAELMGS